MATSIPSNPDTLLRRTQAAEALTAAGFPVAAKTLATKAVRGGGPTYRVFGRSVLYRWGDALEWAESRLSQPRRSTSEADAVSDAGKRTCLTARAERPTHHDLPRSSRPHQQ
jgi:hypothetical protein